MHMTRQTRVRRTMDISGLIFVPALLTLVLVLMLAPVQALAQNKGGGFTGPGPGLVTVAQAKSMADDAKVALKGYIIQSLGGEKYIFKDDSGTITVEIDDEDWMGLTVGPSDLVEIQGEVDKEWTKVEIDVDRIVKVQ